GNATRPRPARHSARRTRRARCSRRSPPAAPRRSARDHLAPRSRSYRRGARCIRPIPRRHVPSERPPERRSPPARQDTRDARECHVGPCPARRHSSSIVVAAPARLMVSDPLLVALALGLVLLNAFFTAAEFAMVRVRPTRMAALAAEGHWQARAVIAMQRRLDRFLSATQLGITLTSFGLGWLGEPAFANMLGGMFAALGITSPVVIRNTSITIAFAFITFLHIVVGELAPKSYAIRFTERVALWVALPMRIFQFLFAPALWLL